jgi:hypothetical protein
MGTDSSDVKSIFYEALQTSVDERAAFLESRCGQNTALHAEIESLLRSHERANGFLPSPDVDLGGNPESGPVVEGPGTVIGRYKLLEKIGEGGMAVVYMAEQTEQIGRASCRERV